MLQKNFSTVTKFAGLVYNAASSIGSSAGSNQTQNKKNKDEQDDLKLDKLVSFKTIPDNSIHIKEKVNKLEILQLQRYVIDAKKNIKPFVMGATDSELTNFLLEKAAEKKLLGVLGDSSKDMKVFMTTLLDMKKVSGLLDKVNRDLEPIIAKYFTDPSEMSTKDQLNAVRSTVTELAVKYGFSSEVFETGEGVLLLYNFIEGTVENNRVLLDIGENGHGALAHFWQTCLLAKLEENGEIENAQNTYKELGTDSNRFNGAEFDYKFKMLDSIDKDLLFANPATMANFCLDPSRNPEEKKAIQFLTNICKSNEKEFQQLVKNECQKQDFEGSLPYHVIKVPI